jgi:hypothetical protein
MTNRWSQNWGFMNTRRICYRPPYLGSNITLLLVHVVALPWPRYSLPHGFRSTFRDWCSEAAEYPRDLADAALAHTLRDKTEAA